ncbi:rhomboid family intramembrane serine protease [Thiotrichales bacterium 19S11-10]|nr:rhomboid family intramembrane serine protease [Thiotrichales bacterium 19S11-10]MCF6806906.1 rhomboid family intramembrane serine protease [Thiotrichales bacterium 19S9-11]MCF6810875.1 rhomboid family intramembrane serine protease [Thiotrichales bacterium 19S9-12]
MSSEEINNFIWVYLPFVFQLCLIFYIVHIINIQLKHRLNYLGIIPRNPRGLFGIIFSPFLHGDFSHLFANSLMFIVLGGFMMFYGKAIFLFASLMIILLSGLLTWLFGRRAIHIGASALIMGYWSFLLTNAFIYPNLRTVAIAIVCALQLGYLVFSMLPSKEKKVSWEGHLFGFISGIVTSFLLPYVYVYLFY